MLIIEDLQISISRILCLRGQRQQVMQILWLSRTLGHGHIVGVPHSRQQPRTNMSQQELETHGSSQNVIGASVQNLGEVGLVPVVQAGGTDAIRASGNPVQLSDGNVQKI